MSFLRFGYLRLRSVALFIAVLALVSTLFSVTAYCFLGFYNGFSGYVGEDSDVVAVYSKIGSTPFTGTVSIDLTKEIACLHGVEAVSPEVVAPVTVLGQSVFFRGVLPSAVEQLNSMNIITGSPLRFNDTSGVMLGEALAGRLHLETGDTIIVYGVLCSRTVELQIKAVFESNSPLNDEALVSLYVGQWLRGATYGDATFIRAKIDPAQTNINQIYLQLQNISAPSQSTATPTSTIDSQTQRELDVLIPLSRTNINLDEIGVEKSSQFMQVYLSRYGVSRDTLLVLSGSVLFFASATAAVTVGLLVKQHQNEIQLLRSIGVAKKRLKFDLYFRFLLFVAVATVLGTLGSALAVTVFADMNTLLVLSHTVNFRFDPAITAANFGLLSLIIGFYVAKSEWGQ